jgi:hypothetical protein
MAVPGDDEMGRAATPDDHQDGRQAASRALHQVIDRDHDLLGVETHLDGHRLESVDRRAVAPHLAGGAQRALVAVEAEARGNRQ